MRGRKSRSIPAILIGICCLSVLSIPLTQPAQAAPVPAEVPANE